jgi:hypothetical protein
VLRVRVPAGARARSVARVELAYRSEREVRAARDLEVSYGAVPARDGAAARVVIDASLAAALDAAGTAILHGDREAAGRALDDHAAFVEGRIEHAQNEQLRARVRVVRRLRRAVDELLPNASHAQRRQTALSFGALAVRIAR